MEKDSRKKYISPQVTIITIFTKDIITESTGFWEDGEDNGMNDNF